ncbi:repressor of RNA polymerase III transcription MAF1 [Myriangium duriaei CBS 260.36]|uniref:Repressor of RNA polymerase III transcription MAF1 n=1 Tax=Myriangium duriaei CBS 260.36 TaxID=1168546 RepID=A0A9P4MI93_9PEZI|nr:repressor of RNA polymerase III transcription MAF1 [Myriangium duriaei CBS 260.36]
MKYIASRECQIVTDALNFSTADCHIIGSCDVYTTKAAGGDKKLYKNIENYLESQHESLVRLSASLSPPQMPVDGRQKEDSPILNMPQVDLSRDSPFGPLSEISSRRTFAYLIATLNASHPDYDFSNALRPTDFKRTSGTAIRKVVDNMMYHLRPRRMSSAVVHPSKGVISASAPGIPSAEVMWSEAMWELVDKEIDMRQCEKYIWEPEDDPFEDESPLWSHNFFFFNKDKKRVLYMHFGAFSVISHSPLYGAMMPMRAVSVPKGDLDIDDGASKRAQYWLGHSVDEEGIHGSWRDSEDVYEGEYTDDLDDIREHLRDGFLAYDEDDDYIESDDIMGWSPPVKHIQHHRAPSESLADAMEM